jgi:hypothetical protein
MRTSETLDETLILAYTYFSRKPKNLISSRRSKVVFGERRVALTEQEVPSFIRQAESLTFNLFKLKKARLSFGSNGLF